MSLAAYLAAAALVLALVVLGLVLRFLREHQVLREGIAQFLEEHHKEVPHKLDRTQQREAVRQRLERRLGHRRLDALVDKVLR